MENAKEAFERSFDSLEELADTISDVLRCSVTIEDANHQLIAYSSHQEETDPARISTIIGKRVPEKVVQALWRNGVIQRLAKSGEPVIVPAIEDVGLGGRVAVAIRKHQDVLGYIWVVSADADSRTEWLFDRLKHAARAACTKLLQLQMSHRKAERGHREFFRQLLAGDLKSDAEVKHQAVKHGLRLPDYYCVNVLPFPSEITDKQQQQLAYLIAASLRSRIVLQAADNELLVMLEAHSAQRPTDKSSPACSLLAEQMTQRFDCAPLPAGCGAIYADYAQVARSYKEALTVIRLRRKFPDALHAVRYYADLGFYRLLPDMELDQPDERHNNEYLHRLEMYDLKHNGELLRTLDVYLGHDSNIKESADALHIHENTLSYRLKRISQISGLDLASMDQKVTCYIELKAKRLHAGQ